MKYLLRLISGIILGILLASCGAIPTLPSLDSTITISTPGNTVLPVDITATADGEKPTLSAVTSTAKVQQSQTPEPQSSATRTTVLSSPTPGASATAKPSATATQIPTATASFTPTAVPYVLQQPDPYYLSNFTHPDDGCNWMGVAGQVFNKDGQVQKEIVIKAGGFINGAALIEDTVMPLTEPEIDLAYGPGGFELTLAAEVAATDSEAWIQLYNLAGDPLSAKIYLVTFDDCLKNLILMNFSEN